MCDNLGIDNTPVLVYKFTYLGQTCIFTDGLELLAAIQAELESIGVDDDTLKACKMKIVFGVMTRSEVEALPEFEGF